MLTTEQLKVKQSLTDTIQKWYEKNHNMIQDLAFQNSTGDHLIGLMGDAAFNIMLAQKDLHDYLIKDGQLED